MHRSLAKRVQWLITIVLAVSLLTLGTPVWSQAVSATLLGNVTDNTGAAVPNAAIQILESSTGITHTTTANGSGNFTFPDLTPGTYAVSVEVERL